MHAVMRRRTAAAEVLLRANPRLAYRQPLTVADISALERYNWLVMETGSLGKGRVPNC